MSVEEFSPFGKSEGFGYIKPQNDAFITTIPFIVRRKSLAMAAKNSKIEQF